MTNNSKPLSSIKRRDLQCVFALACTVSIGCSGNAVRLAAPSVDRGAARAAIEMYDTNRDGAIADEELDNCPAIAAARTRVDLNADGRITADEIEHRIDAWRQSRIALMPVIVSVRTNGRRIEEAQVKFVPESWLGTEIRTATGTTDSDGMANMSVTPQNNQTGVNPGFYRIEVSKQQNGKELIASVNNSQTRLGVEVTSEALELQHLPINLRSQ
jgi:hypothetical protein